MRLWTLLCWYVYENQNDYSTNRNRQFCLESILQAVLHISFCERNSCFPNIMHARLEKSCDWIDQRIQRAKSLSDEKLKPFLLFVQRSFSMRRSEIFHCACVVTTFYDDRPGNHPVQWRSSFNLFPQLF